MARQFRSDDTSPWFDRFGSGADGALTISADTTEAPIDSACTGTTDTLSLSATNASFAAGQIILIHQTQGTGVGSWELNKIASYSAGTITLSYKLQNTYASGAQVRVLKQYSNVTVDSTKTYTAKAWNGTVGGILAFLANGVVTVTGNISASAKGYRGGANDPGSDPQDGYQGEGQTGTGSQSTGANGMGGGGAAKRAGDDAGGGGGGYGASGANGEDRPISTAGSGGGTDGNAGLTSMLFGGGGGGTGGTGTDGGDGGGIVFIIGKSISVSGSVISNGETISTIDMAGGGGAGGSVLLKAQSATLGTTLITASGGTAVSSGTTDGGTGGVGRIHIDYSSSLSGSGSPAFDSRQDPTLADFGGGIFTLF